MISNLWRKPAKSWEDLVEEVLRKATMPESGLHGEQHWRAVAHSGSQIAAVCPEADAGVVFAFALIHDSQRLDDGWDNEHGLRAARFSRQLAALPGLLSETARDQLYHACRLHEAGQVTDDPVVGACWDADRVNLWRVGIMPDPAYFSVLEPGQGFEQISASARDNYRSPPAWSVLINTLRPEPSASRGA